MGAVDGVDDPACGRIGTASEAVFLAEDGVVGVAGDDRLADGRLHLDVRAAVAARSDAVGGVRQLDGEREQLEGLEVRH